MSDNKPPAKFDLSQASATPPQFEFVMAVQVEISPKMALGDTPMGHDRYIVDMLDGYFEGPNLRGRVLRGGADWAFIRPDGVFSFDAAYGCVMSVSAV